MCTLKSLPNRLTWVEQPIDKVILHTLGDSLRNKTVQELILPYYLYCLSGLSDSLARHSVYNWFIIIINLLVDSIQYVDWLECAGLVWIFSKEVFWLNFPKLSRHFPGKHYVSGVYFLYNFDKALSARLLGIKNTISFQAVCVSPTYYKDGFGPRISLHLCLHDDNQQQREKLSQLADCFLYITPKVWGFFWFLFFGFFLGGHPQCF